MAGFQVKSNKPIRDLPRLRRHLIDACQLELSTIPLYLYALYSLKIRTPPVRQSTASVYSPLGPYEILRTVAIEEMLHLLLARNLLLAVGGDVSFADPHFMPTYPSPMLHREPPLVLHLAPCSMQQIEAFLHLEAPASPGKPPTPDPLTYHCIAEFYESIEEGFVALRDRIPWARTGHQIGPMFHPYWNESGGGGPVVVKDLDSAREAIRIIVRQGEGNRSGVVGFDPSRPAGAGNLPAYSHHERFRLIKTGREPIAPPPLVESTLAIWPLETDPDPIRWDGPVRALGELFDACYCYLLRLIDAAYALPYPKRKVPRHRKYLLLQNLLTSMGGVLFPIADLLVQKPGTPDEQGAAQHAGPTFRYQDLPGAHAAARKQHLLDRFDRLGPLFPSLVGENSPRWFAALLEPV